jgi:hypothetical protein
MPTPFVRRYQKHVTIKLRKGERITIIRPPKGVSVMSHPLDESNKQNPEYANLSFLADDTLGMHRSDMHEKIDEVLSSLNIVDDRVTNENIKKMSSSREKRGPCNLYFYESPQLDGEFDYLRSQLVKIRHQYIPKEQIKQVNDIFTNKLGYDHGIAENKSHHIMGELYSTNNV